MLHSWRTIAARQAVDVVSRSVRDAYSRQDRHLSVKGRAEFTARPLRKLRVEGEGRSRQLKLFRRYQCDLTGNALPFAAPVHPSIGVTIGAIESSCRLCPSLFPGSPRPQQRLFRTCARPSFRSSRWCRCPYRFSHRTKGPGGLTPCSSC